MCTFVIMDMYIYPRVPWSLKILGGGGATPSESASGCIICWSDQIPENPSPWTLETAWPENTAALNQDEDVWQTEGHDKEQTQITKDLKYWFSTRRKEIEI